MALALDNSSVTSNSAVSNPTTLTLTTASAVAGTFCLGITLLGQSGLSPSVSSISTTGLTWGVKKTGTYNTNAGLGNRNCQTELWEATTATAFGSQTTTVNITNTQNCCAVLFLMGATTGNDANASVPGYATGAGAAGATNATINVSTNGSASAIIAFSGNSDDVTNGAWDTAGAGFTDISNVRAAGSQFSSIGAYYVIVTSSQTNLAVNSSSATSQSGNHWFIVSDALDGTPVPTATPPASWPIAWTYA